MSGVIVIVRSVVPLIVALVLCRCAGTQTSSVLSTVVEESQPKPVPMKAVFKNIQVLKGVPSTELLPIMNFMRSSLGVRCEYCHVAENGKYWLDEKAEKQRARSRRLIGKVGRHLHKASASCALVGELRLPPQLDLQPAPPQVSWEDAGNGLVAVTILGTYAPGTAVVIGSSLIGTGSPAYFYDPQKIRVLVPAAQLLQTNEIELEEQGGTQRLVLNKKDQAGKLVVIKASARPLTSTDSLVEVRYTVAQEGQGDPHLQPLALVGGTAFGLSDNPIVVTKKECMTPGNDTSCTLTFRAPTALVRSARKVKLRQLFFGSLADPNEAKIDIPNDLTAQKLVTVAKTTDCTLFAVQGSGLADPPDPAKPKVKVIIADKELKSKTDVDPKSRCHFSAANAPASNNKEKR